MVVEELGFIVMSGEMTASQNKKGEWKKRFSFRPNWENLKKSDIRTGESARAIVCGKASNCIVIDIDDPTTEQNMNLMDLMTECNLVQRTKHGFHYVFAYDERLRNTQGDKLDIRSDGGCIFTEPSIASDNEGNIVACYEWIKTPIENQLVKVPEEVIDYLKQIGGDRYVRQEEAEPAELSESSETTEASEPMIETDKILLKVIDALPMRFLDSYSDWITIGMVLFNEGYTLEDWDMISRKSDKYDGSCKIHWASFKRTVRGVTSATLWNWLKQTNLTTFYSLMETRKDFWDLVTLLNNNDGAKYFYSIHPDAYLYNEHLGWYSLGAHNIWRRFEKGQPSGMKTKIADTLQGLVMDMKKAELIRYARESDSEKDRKKQDELIKVHTERIRIIHSAYIKFGSSDFCNGLLAFLPPLYDDPDLENKMDRNGRVFAFTDKLVDLETGLFRKILPNDYISVTCGYPAPTQTDSAVQQKIKHFLYGLFENEQTQNYLMNVLSSCLFGGNRWEEFYVFTGNGGNGKSVLADCLKYIFGDYYLSVESNLLTKTTEKKDQPCPALVDARSSRVMLSTEPEASDKLQVGLLKKISGNDVIEARTLYTNKITKYVPMYKLLILANDIPSLSKIDGGLTRRMRILHFPFKFVACPSQDYERVGDPDLKDKIIKTAEWRDQFFLLLLENYLKIKDWKSLPISSAVKETSEEYLDENNPVKQWLEEHYEIGGIHKIGVNALYSQYCMDKGRELDQRKFSQLVVFNGIVKKRFTDGFHFVGLTRKE